MADLIVVLQSLANDRFVCADDTVTVVVDNIPGMEDGAKSVMTPGRPLQANRAAAGTWEKFRVWRVMPDGSLQPIEIPDAPQPGPDPSPGLPPAPSREEILTAPWLFQGLTVTTSGLGTLPWFDLAYTSPALDVADRASVLKQLKAAGSWCTAIAVSWRYAEPDCPYINVPGADLTTGMPTLCARLEEVIRAGMHPYLFLAGDGQSVNANPQPGQYNDPVGHTYGYQWLMNNFERIALSVQSAGLADYTVFVPGFDAVFYGWDPGQVDEFGKLFRRVLPNGYLAIEHDTGHIPVGNGPADYRRDGIMQNYDAVISEFALDLSQDSCWQVAARMLGPKYVRPPDQPAGDDPTPPWYLAYGTGRGRFVTRAFEFATYDWVRGRVALSEVNKKRDYLRAMGYPSSVVG